MAKEMDDSLMLAVGMTPEEIKEKNLKQRTDSALKLLAKTIFEKTKISIEAAAKSIVPDIPKFIRDIAVEISTGPADKINETLEKLDHTVNKFNIDLGKYNQGLASFTKQWQEKREKAETEVEEYRKQGVKAEVSKYNEVNVLSRREINNYYEKLDILNYDLRDRRKELELDTKILQNKKISEKDEIKLKKKISDNINKISIEVKAREELIQKLGPEAEERKPGLFSNMKQGFGRFSGKVGQFTERYVPGPIRDMGSMFLQGFKTPIDIIKDLTSQIMEFGKPLRLITDPMKKLGKGLFNLSDNLFKFDKGFNIFQGTMTKFSSLGKNIVSLFTRIGGALRIFGAGILGIIMNPIFLAFAGIAGAGALIAYLLNKFVPSDKGLPPGVSKSPGSAGDIRGETYMPDDYDLESTSPTTKMEQSPNINEKKIYPQTKENIVPEEKESIFNQFFQNKGKMSLNELQENLKKGPLEQMTSTMGNIINNQPITNISNNQKQIATMVTGTRNEDFWFNKGLST